MIINYICGDLATSSPTIISEKPLFKQYIARGVKFKFFLKV